MKRIALFAVVCLVAGACCEKKVTLPEADPVDYVSTLVGSMSKHSLSTGNTHPAAGRPWGMHFWTPQNANNNEERWIYTYDRDRISALRQIHQPSPWIGDYGAFGLMPVTTGPVFTPQERASWYSHKTEVAKPYYYSVYLAEHDVLAELSPTERAAAFRLTYPKADMSYLVVDAYKGPHGASVKIIPSENKIIGYSTQNSGGVAENFRNYFVIVSDTPFEWTGTAADGVLAEGTECEGENAVALVGFKTVRGQQVNLRVASSFISPEQAEINLAELGDGDFDRIKEEGRDVWNKTLGRIEVTDGNIDNLRTFYSCLYRSVLYPRDLSEVTAEGKRVHYSPGKGTVEEGYYFTDTGFWDTFRSLFALMDLVYPDEAAKVQEGLVNVWKETGFLPEWASPGHRGCMVGQNSASVVAEAYLKGIRGYDVEELYKAIVHGAHNRMPDVHSTGRWGHEYYDSLGYVPCDVGINENAARTLEYAYDDWCIYRLGKALGKSEEETSYYRNRAFNYKNLFNKDYNLMVGRNKDGSWHEPFSVFKWGGDFTEGNALHYTWSVFQDPAGLIDLMGGDDKFNAMLDTVFTLPPFYDESYYHFVIHEIREMQIMNMGNYAHGNQPIQHMVYLYDWSRQPWKVQQRAREIMNKFYNANPDGYCGDEDNGQTSAWYIFSALGFYPVCPASAQYALGAPLFKHVKVNLPSGKKIIIDAPDNSAENFYVDAMKFNGRNYTRNYLEHSDLVKGAKIFCKMSSSPNLSRGTADADLPYSLSKE